MNDPTRIVVTTDLSTFTFPAARMEVEHHFKPGWSIDKGLSTVDVPDKMVGVTVTIEAEASEGAEFIYLEQGTAERLLGYYRGRVAQAEETLAARQRDYENLREELARRDAEA